MSITKVHYFSTSTSLQLIYNRYLLQISYSYPDKNIISSINLSPTFCIRLFIVVSEGDRLVYNLSPHLSPITSLLYASRKRLHSKETKFNRIIKQFQPPERSVSYRRTKCFTLLKQSVLYSETECFMPQNKAFLYIKQSASYYGLTQSPYGISEWTEITYPNLQSAPS